MTQLFYSIYPHVLFNAHVRWCCVLDKWCLINKVCLITRVCSKWSNFGNFQIKIQFTVSNKFLSTDAWSKKCIPSLATILFAACFYAATIRGVYFFGKLSAELGGCIYYWQHLTGQLLFEGSVYFFGRAGFILLRASDYVAAIGGGIYSKKYVIVQTNSS